MRKTTFAARQTLQSVLHLREKAKLSKADFKKFCEWLGYNSYLYANSHDTNKKILMALEDLVINATSLYEEQYNEQ